MSAVIKTHPVVAGWLMFRCPGCNDIHTIVVGDGPAPHSWNGDMVRPTFAPSVLCTSGHYSNLHKPGAWCWCTYDAEHPDDPLKFRCERCHSFVRDGQIQFLDDCSHPLKNQTVPLPEWVDVD